MFLQDSYYSSVSPLASSILTVRATDKDNGRNARIRYSLAKDSKNFKIDPRNGKLTSVKKRLRLGKHVLTVYAEDQSIAKRRSQVTCSITVHSGINRSPLTISFSERKPKLYENVALNTLVTIVRVNKVGVQYRIVGGNIGHAFSISQRGRVSVATTLDYERVRVYRLVIRVLYKSRGKLEVATEV